MTNGHESLVDIQSSTWDMVSRRLGCLDIPDNLIITSSPADGAQSSPPLRLSVTLPHYGLSFFVNENGDLESRDFKDMVCDENQCIGTLVGLVNRLILRPKTQFEEDLIPRCILIPDGEPCLEWHGHQPRVVITPRKKRRPNDMLCHIYKVDGTLGCLTGISSLRSRLYPAKLHSLTNNACRPDQLTGRTGVEEAISLAWLAGERLLSDSVSHEVNIKGLGAQKAIAIAKYHDGPYKFDAKLEHHRNDVLQEAYLYPSELVAQLPEEDRVRVNIHEPSLSDDLDLVYIAASTVDRWSLNAPIMNDLSSWAEAWGDTIAGDNPSSQLEGLQSNSTVPPFRIKIYNLLGRGGSEGGGATRRFQLLFSLPVMVYSSENRQGTLLSTLVAFSKQPHIHLENSPRYAEYNLSDGYHPESQRIYACVSKACHSRLVMEIEAAVKQLLGSWPSETVPTASLDPDRFDVASLNASLQPLFSSWYRNFKLKQYLTRVCAKPISLRLPPNSCKLEPPSADWQTTLDQLLRERRAPELPLCHRLPHRKAGSNAISSSDISRLGQLFSRLPTDGRAPGFQTQYVARLQASAQHVRAEEPRAGIPSGSAVRPLTETFREHYKQCKASYTKSLHTVKTALGPITQVEQILDRCGQWPRATPYTLFRCLASTSPINPPGNWRKCLISLTLLALELQRARRLLQFSSDNLEEEFFKEFENEGGDGWVAAEHPDWLLIQVHIPCLGT